MAKEKMQHCFNCGKEIGVFASYSGDINSCGERECQNAERDAYQERESIARERAAEDGYAAYGGSGW